jgi:acyl-CoA synthetase (AMP-forming)/AMP-acid ligase II
MPVSVLQRGAQLFDVEWWQGYGMTETSGNLVFLGPADHKAALSDTPQLLRATGRPAGGVEVRIVDEDGSVVPPDTSGEVQVRSEQIFVGYWGDPAASEAALTTDGWLNTGDVGRVDLTGLLWLIDRKKDIIITGGENVSAREVEEVVRAWPPVADVAVVGVPDERWGENICAVVVVRPGAALNVDALIRHTRQHLAGFKVPRHIVETSVLPVNASGKVVKAEIRRWLLDHVALLGERR